MPATARRQHLRAVSTKPGERKPKPSVAQAAESGDHRALLVAMRDRIAKTVSDPECPPRDLAALTRRLQDIAHELDAIDQRAKQEAQEDGDIHPDDRWDPEAI